MDACVMHEQAKTYEQRKAICEELGDRAGVARAYANLGNCYYSTGDYVRAREMPEVAARRRHSHTVP